MVGEGTPALPPAAYLAALAGLPLMGPARLGCLLAGRSPFEAWAAAANRHAVLADAELIGRMGSGAVAIAEGWRRAAVGTDVATLWAAHEGIVVAGLADPAYPAPLVEDPEPPSVVFLRGDPAVVAGPRVAVVGTRRCTRAGFELARELGHDLARAGVRVVSGLALGVDGAAHRGALDGGPGSAPPIGVVASGLDVVYPRAHVGLWHEVVAAGGLLVSECPLGTRPEPWRFPARNRIIAALADAVVVVESRETGGSMHTVDSAVDRGVPVLAVPGPVRSAASAGTNKLLFEGCAPARDAADVLGALGIDPAPASAPDARPAPGPAGRRVLKALGWEAATLETLAGRTALDLGPLALAVEELEAGGWIARQGLWFERTGSE